MNLLIVDDHAINLRLLRAQLEAEGHTVAEATNGIEALRVLEREPVDGVISDILMPGMDGFQLCLEIRKSKKFNQLPFILYTSTYNSAGDRRLAQSVGADQYLSKPAPTPVILDALREAIGKSRPPASSAVDRPNETYVLKQYSEALVHKLEEKNAELQESERRLREMLDNMELVSLMFDRDARITYCNDYFLRLTGWSRDDVLGRNWFELFIPPELDHLKDVFAALLAGTSGARHQKYEILTRTGRRRLIQWNNTLLRAISGELIGVASIGGDITEQQQAEEARRQSAALYQHTLDNMLEGCQIIDFDWRYRYVNAASARQYRQPVEALIGRTMMEAFPGFEATEMYAKLRRCMGERIAQHSETEFVFPDGAHAWFDVNVLPAPEGISIFSVDITERKQAKEMLEETNARLQVLAGRILEVQETERAAIARELHDQLGQTFVAVKLNLQVMQRRADAPSFTASIDESIKAVNVAVQQVRALALELRPPQLDELGLVTALRSYAERLATTSELEIKVVSPLLEALPPRLDIACFRIVQEALTNIIRHAAAKCVQIELWVQDGTLCLTIKDDGRGFDVTATRERALHGRSMGLLGMEERAHLIGGGLRINSNPSAGTNIYAEFPLGSSSRLPTAGAPAQK